jgi:hypothetical protein
MVGVAQGLERRPVEPQVAGSNPVTHPIKNLSFNLKFYCENLTE